MTIDILHLTHTHIATDSRILKAMLAADAADFSVAGIGMSAYEETLNSSLSKKLNIIEISFKTTYLAKKLPKFLRIPFLLLSFVVFSLNLIVFGIRFRPSLVHCNDTLVLPAGLIIKLFTGCKIIYDAHELESDRNGITRLEAKIYFSLEKYCWRFLDGLITVSPGIDDWYKNNIGPKLSEVILNSPFISKDDKYSKSYLKDYFKILGQHKVFIYAGMFAKGRGLENLIAAFKSDDINSHLVLLGYGPLSKTILDASSAHDNIHFHPAIEHENVVSLIRSADIGVCFIGNVSLSDYHCLPNKLFEYAFSGTPVVASNFPDISALVSEFNLGIIVSDTFDSIKTCIREIEEIDVKKSFLNKDLSSLSWDAQTEKLIELYNTVLSK